MPSYHSSFGNHITLNRGLHGRCKEGGTDDDRHHKMQRPFVRVGTTDRGPFDLVHVALKSRVTKKRTGFVAGY